MASLERSKQPPPLQPQVSRRSVRTRSTTSDGVKGEQSDKGKWETVKESIIDGTLKFVGLRPYDDENRHWVAVNHSIAVQHLKDKKTLPPRHKAELVRQSSITAKESAVVRALTGYSVRAAVPSSSLITSPSPREETDFGPGGVVETEREFDARAAWKRSVIKTELKPDLWKVAYNSIKSQVTMPRPRKERKEAETHERPGLSKQKSFYGEEAVAWPSVVEGDGMQPSGDFTDYGKIIPRQEKDIFFGTEDDFVEGVDSAYAAAPPTVAYGAPIPHISKAEPTRTPDSNVHVRRNKLDILRLPFDAGYSRDCGGLGLTTYLLRFKYKGCFDQEVLDSQLLHKRPYFSYWLMVVHVIVMVIALAVYGFAPYGWDYVPQRGTVRMTNLAFVTSEINLAGSIWGGPPQQSLVLLGALFAPCMRSDRQLALTIDRDRMMEATESGCCVRRDGSGCFQTFNNSECLPRFSQFSFETGSSGTPIRAVCGMSPETCTNPDVSFFPSWEVDDLLTWPICRNDTNSNSSQKHLTCELVGRPCCFGIQASCNITTREHCEFLQGRFHQDAFLCSQVDCLSGICGLLPFTEPNKPDQFYRLWIALFLHAGLIHLILSLLFSFFVLRHVEKRLGWLRTAFVYILSGIGGNLVSIYFVPYNPNVGPAASILGIWAYVFVFWIFESHLLYRPYVELLKLLAILFVLLAIGFLPYVDNFAHIGGFVFGFLLSGIIIPYGNYKRAWHKIAQEPDDNRYDITKKVLLVVGIIGNLFLAALFLVLFYVVQDTWSGFSYITCIPFTRTFCIDMQAFLRNRSDVVV